jgi:hypothetical protein
MFFGVRERHLNKLLLKIFSKLDSFSFGITSKMMSDKVNESGYEVEWGLYDILNLGMDILRRELQSFWLPDTKIVKPVLMLELSKTDN